MRLRTSQIQDLLEALYSLRLQQKELLACTESQEIDALPQADLEAYHRLEREREAKGKYLTKLAGREDEIGILLDQLRRLTEERHHILISYEIDNPLQLPIKEIQRYIRLWEASDFVAGVLERLV